jgi:hypothetical protein
MDEVINMNIKNFIDLHVHIGPEPIPRKFTISEIVKKQAGKIKGLALKNHFYPTTPMIESDEKIQLIGSVTLNNYIGGLNSDAVYASAKLQQPIIVWFPTINAENFLKQGKHEIPIEWVGKNFKSRYSKDITPVKITKNNILVPEAREVLNAIKQNNCILATGHITWREAKILVKEALKIGIEKIIVTHPIYQLINMPVRVQKELAQNKGVYIEQCYTMYSIDKIPVGKIADQIKIIGAENCIISSDVGQMNSPSPSEAMKKFCRLLTKQGITKKELRIMGEVNPKKLIYPNANKYNR